MFLYKLFDDQDRLLYVASLAAAAKEASYQARQSFNAWAQEAFAFYLAHLAAESSDR